MKHRTDQGSMDERVEQEIEALLFKFAKRKQKGPRPLPERLNIHGCRILACAVISSAIRRWVDAYELGNRAEMESSEWFFKGSGYSFWQRIVADRLPEKLTHDDLEEIAMKQTNKKKNK